LTERRFILWDIDGTLVRAGAIARIAFDRAIAHALDLESVEHAIQMSGKTDPQIALEILDFLGVAEADAHRHLPLVLERLEAELAAGSEELRTGGRTLPGVTELLPRLHDTPGVTQSALTGNTRTNAIAKLTAFGLDPWIDTQIGAYGSDHADRKQLVPIALERARRLRALHFDPDEVWIVGDTPHDLACARVAGAHAVLVATGRVQRHELDGIGADAVFDDLSDVDAVMGMLTGR
jgi:phosphoglycolate phosphatase-like HAD superfamily hydrolase